MCVSKATTTHFSDALVNSEIPTTMPLLLRVVLDMLVRCLSRCLASDFAVMIYWFDKWDVAYGYRYSDQLLQSIGALLIQPSYALNCT